jgi:hypothetical protein
VKTAWNWIKSQYVWLYVGLLAALSVANALTGEWVVFGILVGCAALMVALRLWNKEFRMVKTFEQGEIELLLSLRKGAEPVNDEPMTFERHRQESPDCPLCKEEGAL